MCVFLNVVRTTSSFFVCDDGFGSKQAQKFIFEKHIQLLETKNVHYDVCMCVNMFVCVCATRVYLCVRMCVCARVCVRAYMCARVYVCMGVLTSLQ